MPWKLQPIRNMESSIPLSFLSKLASAVPILSYIAALVLLCTHKRKIMMIYFIYLQEVRVVQGVLEVPDK
jgi:hypothetical protein